MRKMRLRVLGIFSLILLFLFTSTVQGQGGKAVVERSSPSDHSFVFVAKRFGIPILKASIRIENERMEEGKRFHQIEARVESLNAPGFLFRINNRFISTMEADTCIPIRYVKEIRQEGLFLQNKHYSQVITFDHENKKVISEKPEKKEREELSLPPWTFDPLSMFGRYYLKEKLELGKNLRMSVYDGFKMRQMVFAPKAEKVKSKVCGEVEAFCLESTTSFASFGEKEGVIRIWYQADGKKTPLALELDLPVGSLRFELEEINEG